MAGRLLSRRSNTHRHKLPSPRLKRAAAGVGGVDRPFEAKRRSSTRRLPANPCGDGNTPEPSQLVDERAPHQPAGDVAAMQLGTAKLRKIGAKRGQQRSEW